MKIVEIKNIIRKEVAIYYMMEYTGTAVIEIPLRTVECPLSFTIEVPPIGQKNIEVTLDSGVEYPLLPVTKALKEHILVLDREGGLPLC